MPDRPSASGHDSVHKYALIPRLRRLTLTRWVALVVLVVATGGVVASPLIFRSPAQARDSRQAPIPPPALAIVTMRSLGGQRLSTCAYTSAVMTVHAPLRAEAETGVVGSTVIEIGAPVVTGTLLLDVDGVPVVALVSVGGKDLTRDLRPGDSGTDVLNVEQSLVGAGFLRAADSHFDEATAAAVDQLFRAAGVQNPAPKGLRRDSVTHVAGSGVVADRAVSPGATVSPGDPLFTLSSSPREIRCIAIPGAVLGAAATLKQGPAPVADVIVTKVSSTAGSDSVTFRPARRAGRLPVGDVVIDAAWLPRSNPLLTVPVGALEGAGPVVQRMVNGRAEQIRVSVVAVSNGYAQLAVGPLSEGDRVVVRQPRQSDGTYPKPALSSMTPGVPERQSAPSQSAEPTS